MKKGGVAEISEADRDAMEAREDLWSMCGLLNFHFSPSRYAQKSNCMYREPALPCAEQLRIPTAKALTQKTAVPKEAGGRPVELGEGLLSLTISERKQTRSNPKGAFFTEDEIINLRNTCQMDDLTRGIITIWYTRQCRSAKP